MSHLFIARKRQRLPGEVAFDRCFFPVAALFVANAFAWVFAFRHFYASKLLTKEELAAPILPSAWHTLLPSTVAVVLAVLWWRAAVGVVRAWRDPSARVLRFSASVLLILFASAAFHFVSILYQ